MRAGKGVSVLCMRCGCVLRSQTECATQAVSPVPGVLVACACAGRE
jgi:hypothetical protein